MALRLAAVLLTAASGSATPGFRFVAVGDWGGHNDEVPVAPPQQLVADGMAKVAGEIGAEMVLLLGDNFYTEGVSECPSPRFNETFENVYTAPPLMDLPFYVVAGNHDHRGNVQAQLDYAHLNKRWNFPSLNYNLERSWYDSTGRLRTLKIIFVDTEELAGEMPGEPVFPVNETTWKWLEEELMKSDSADFLWVAGHYPIYSVGMDGTMQTLVDRLLPMLAAHGAHYMSGHDHMFEHIVHSGVNMVLAGAGRECCYDIPHWNTVPPGAMQFLISGIHGGGKGVGNRTSPGPVKGGFASFEFLDTVAEVSFHSETGAKLYTAPPIPARFRRVEEEVLV